MYSLSIFAGPWLGREGNSRLSLQDSMFCCFIRHQIKNKNKTHLKVVTLLLLMCKYVINNIKSPTSFILYLTPSVHFKDITSSFL